MNNYFGTIPQVTELVRSRRLKLFSSDYYMDTSSSKNNRIIE